MHKSCINEQRKLLSHAVWATKPFRRVQELVFRHQGGQPSCYMELFDEKLTEYTTFGNHSLVHYIRIVACNKRYPSTVCHTKLWITQLCYARNEPSHCRKYHGTYLISIAGTMTPPTRCYMHLYGILQTHGLPHQEKHCQCKSGTHRCGTNATWMHCVYPNHFQHAVCYKGDRTASNQQLRAKSQHSH